MLARIWRNSNLIHYWWKCKIIQYTVENNMRLLEKLNIDLPYDPAISLLGIHPKECDSGYSKASAHPCTLQHYSQ
jgi:hypothetical protein